LLSLEKLKFELSLKNKLEGVMKRIAILLVIFFLPLSLIGREKNRLAAFWQKPKMKNRTAEKLAKFDLVIIDMENWFTNPEMIDIIHQINPNGKILAYVNPMELFEPQVPGRPLQLWIYQQVQQSYPNWWLNQPDGQPIYYWQLPRMRMLNLSSKCPKHDGMSWLEFLAQILQDSLLSKPNINGLFIDNAFNDVSWLLNGQIDANNDGQVDNPDSLDLWWQQGVAKFLRLTRATIGNEGNLYYQDLLQGKMFENFPPADFGNKWYPALQNYLEMGHLPYNIIHSEAKGKEWRRFILATALLGDGWFCYGTNNTQWFPEYDLIQKLRKPVSNAQPPHTLIWQYSDDKVSLTDEFQTIELDEGEYIVSYKYGMENRTKSQLVCEARSIQYYGIFPYSQQIYNRWLKGTIHQKIKLTAKGKIVWRMTSPDAGAKIWSVKIWRKKQGPWIRQYQGGKVLVWPDQQKGEIIIE